MAASCKVSIWPDRFYSWFTFIYSGKKKTKLCRYLVKTRKEKSGGLSVKYLIDEEKGPRTVDTTPEGILRLYRRVAVGYYLEPMCLCFSPYLFHWYFSRLVDIAIAELENNSRKGYAPHDAWNHAAVHLIKAAQAHARLFVVESFVDSLKESRLSSPVRSILSQLCELFIIYWILDRSGDFFLVSLLTNAILDKSKLSFKKRE